MNEIWLFGIAICVIAYWWFGALSREQALVEAKRLCHLDTLQLLDQTVAQKKQWLARNNQGHISYYRLFVFEFTSTGDQRYQGRILIVGGKVIKSDLDVYRIST